MENGDLDLREGEVPVDNLPIFLKEVSFEYNQGRKDSGLSLDEEGDDGPTAQLPGSLDDGGAAASKSLSVSLCIEQGLIIGLVGPPSEVNFRKLTVFY